MTDLELAEKIERKLQVSYSMRPNSQRSMLLDRCEWQQIIAALRRGPERPPSGEMVMVPREPTFKMVSAGAISNSYLTPRELATRIYRAMLSAAEAEGRKS